MPRTAFGRDLEHAALEDVLVTVEEHGRERPHQISWDVTEHGAVELDGDGVSVVRVIALRLEVERVARFELVEDKRTVVVLESGDIEREQIA